MKRFVKYILSALALGMCLLSCSKDPDVPIHSELDFLKCLRPISFKCSVQYVEVTVNFKAFPDAEVYEMEAYTTDFLALPEGEEPSEEELVHKALLTEEMLPYSFNAPEEINCYIRVRGVNETEGREPSEWVTGHVKTDVDPLTRCATPTDVKITANYNWVTCSLTPMSNVKEYSIELYSKAIPATGDPDPADLIDHIVKPSGDFPFTMKDVPAGTYYYRIQGLNEEAGLKPSKWVKGSFTTADYTWLNVEGTFDYNLASGAKRETKFNQKEITALLPSKSVAAGTTFVWDGVTYGPTCSYSNDKWSFNRCKQWDKATYANDFPLEAYEMIQVTQPGTLSFIPRTGSKDEAKMPEVVLAALTTKGEIVSFDYIYQQKLATSETIATKDEANRLYIEVTEEALYGITEPASLYLFMNLNQVTVYPLSYTRK